MKVIMAGAVVLALASTAAAKVEASNDRGFSVAYETDIAVAPQTAYAKFVEVGQWWSAQHSFSGDAKNLFIEASPGGGWGEKLPDGFVRHLDLVHAEAGKLLVFKGGLGPLAFMGVAGAMTVSFEAKDNGTHVSLRYAVGGYDPEGFKTLPGAVDKVLGDNFASYAAFAAK